MLSFYPTMPKRHKVAYVGTYPPKECGIATFTMDMVNATDLSGWRSIVIAIDDEKTENHHPDKKVRFTIRKDDKQDYRSAARFLTDQKVDLLAIQHEYGIFGGDHGDFVLDLIKSTSVPVVVTLHTVLPNPNESQRRILQQMEPYISGFVVMANTAVDLLQTSYGISRKKIHFIPHGAPNASYHAGDQAKRKFGLTGKRVLSTFGLISPNKGIEDAIAAMPAVVEKEPNAVYMILGQTHPVIKRKEGEWYREQLVQQVADLGLNDNVRFVNHYLSLKQLIDYLLASDIYITPYYANPHQITSGTLAYAMAVGKVIVSTPYIYAKELLDQGRGFLYPFRDTEELSRIVSNLILDDKLFQSTRRAAYAYGRSMTWQSVGIQYTRLFTEMLNEQWVNHRAAADTIALPGLRELLMDGEVMHPTTVSA